MVKQPGFVDHNQRKLLEKCDSTYLYFFEYRASSDNFTANFAQKCHFFSKIHRNNSQNAVLGY